MSYKKRQMSSFASAHYQFGLPQMEWCIFLQPTVYMRHSAELIWHVHLTSQTAQLARAHLYVTQGRAGEPV